MCAVFGSSTFFTTVISSNDLLALFAGYENAKFRYERMAQLMFDALPDFALKYSELTSLKSENVMARIRDAAQSFYKLRVEKSTNRGEFGELLLHLIMRDYFRSIPAISKLYYIDSANSNVKGFDAVHIIPFQDHLELWVGESKFYNNISNAIRDVVTELAKHTSPDFLRDEFLFISRKIDPNWPHALELKKLLSKNTSLDKVFKQMKIAVLLTYDSPIVQNNATLSAEFSSALISELSIHSASFRRNPLPSQVEIQLILVPLEFKMRLIELLDLKLKGLQSV